MSFTQLNLDSNVTKALNACGYKEPTPIQARSIPEILNGHDLVACAQTGTGKTAAFVLPALHRIREKSQGKKPRILILTPTRELAAQITQAATRYGKFLKFHMASLVGGMSYRHQLRDLSRPVDVIVATPGRLLDHLENRRVDLSQIEMLILDEADRMLDMGFIDDVQAIAKVTPKQRQTLLFSATVDGKLNQVIKQLLKEPVQIDLSGEKVAPAKIKQSLYMADSPTHKGRLLDHLLENETIFKAIIFSATKIGADQLAAQLTEKGYAAAPLHGDLKQSLRNRTIENLRKNKIQFVVATDVAARGIDIADMTHVINYDLPRFCEDYVHRIGRTGRAGKSGIAISLALRNDRRHIERIERYIGQTLERATIEGLEPSEKPTKGKKFGADKKAFGKERSFGKGKSFGKERSFGKEKSFSKERPFNKEKSFGKEKPFSKEKSFDKDKPFAKEKSFTKERPFGKEKSFGKEKAFGKERSFSKEKSFDKEKPFGKEKSFSKERSFGKEKPFSKEKSFSKGKPKFSSDERPRTATTRSTHRDNDRPQKGRAVKAVRFGKSGKPTKQGKKNKARYS